MEQATPRTIHGDVSDAFALRGKRSGTKFVQALRCALIKCQRFPMARDITMDGMRLVIGNCEE